MKNYIAGMFPLLFLLVACSPKVLLTQSIRDKYKLNEKELKAIQFYTSDIIVLKRADFSEKEKETTDGTLTIKGGSKVEELVFKAGTPCVVEKVHDGNTISISFESGSNKFLVFGSLHARNGYYVLQVMNSKQKPTVNYGEKLYYVSASNEPVFLVFKIKSLNKFELEQKVVKGRKIGK